MGTQLYERGVLYSACFEELNVSRPELVRARSTRTTCAPARRSSRPTRSARTRCASRSTACRPRVRELNVAGVRVAREAAGGQAYVAGAIGPSGYFLGEAEPATISRR